MEADIWKSCFFKQAFELCVCRAGIKRQFGIGRLREDPLGECFFLPFAQKIAHASRKKYHTVSFARFCFADDGLSVLIAYGSLHVELAVLGIEVRPFQTADLTSAHACHEVGIEEIVPYLIPFDML